MACLLWPLSLIFGGLVRLRRLAFERGWKTATALGVPVIVVGNRILGGAGKTPATLAIVSHLQGRGWHPGLVSRGHGRDGSDEVIEVRQESRASEVGDEPLLLHRHTGVPVFVHRRRALAGARLLSAHPEVDLIIADDGLQHFDLARDVDVVVYDERGAGNGWLLPAGPLREPLDAPGTARHTLVLYTAGKASTPLPGHLGHRRLAGVQALDEWCRHPRGALRPMSSLRGRRLLACAGIARPGVFFAALTAEGLEIDEWPLGDHAPLSPPPWGPEVPEVIVTEKDAIKLDASALARSHPGTQVWVAALDFAPDTSFHAALDAALPEPPRHGPTTA